MREENRPHPDAEENYVLAKAYLKRNHSKPYKIEVTSEYIYWYFYPIKENIPIERFRIHYNYSAHNFFNQLNHNDTIFNKIVSKIITSSKEELLLNILTCSAPPEIQLDRSKIKYIITHGYTLELPFLLGAENFDLQYGMSSKLYKFIGGRCPRCHGIRGFITYLEVDGISWFCSADECLKLDKIAGLNSEKILHPYRAGN